MPPTRKAVPSTSNKLPMMEPSKDNWTIRRYELSCFFPASFRDTAKAEMLVVIIPECKVVTADDEFCGVSKSGIEQAAKGVVSVCGNFLGHESQSLHREESFIRAVFIKWGHLG